MTALRDAAHRYAHLGIPVFPLTPRGKAPVIPRVHPEGDPLRDICRGQCGQQGHGLYDATDDHEQVERWWIRWPRANIGVRTGTISGLLVVDLDGPEGEAAWSRLEETYGPVLTLESRTGTGRHLYFTYPPGLDLGNSKGRLGPHIDTRAEGGYVLAPPSVHPSGALYRWRWADAAPAWPPAWLLDRLATAPGRKRAQGRVTSVVRVMPASLPRHLAVQASEAPGEDRSAQTFRLVVAAVEWGLDDGQIHALAAAHQPTVEKYGARAPAEVDRILDRIRPDHEHVGRPCDRAGCRNAPGWMVTP
jgi:Bifunctional DNA primase/polymerase, N-terminal